MEPCPACGSSEHDGWTDHAECPEDWTFYTGVRAAAFNENLTPEQALESVRAHYEAFDAGLLPHPSDTPQ